MQRILILIIWLFSAFAVQPQANEVQHEPSWLVVVNSNSGLTSLSQEQVISLFLGRTQFLPTGSKAKPFDFPIESNNRASFYEALTGKNIADIDAYWARLRYSGRASPPLPLSNSEEIIKRLREQDSAIAYLPAEYASSLDELGLKAVLTMRYN
ncbi:hypothetical protein KIH87_14105 [Paraneptunicella aestuarii]|uniref:hypothetical protein n=1 Tax=Paraneptunicella aestuarii TaxID=2831148 RepID=UPI001E56432C|nr:hypothetical protein [Paraneptunicella aestuarii]UAA37826.1 hypothetical protein KIH87_14105 [Paraneptunicella aestuarii]